MHPDDGVTVAEWEHPAVTPEGPKEPVQRGQGERSPRCQGWEGTRGPPGALALPSLGATGTGHRGQQSSCRGPENPPGWGDRGGGGAPTCTLGAQLTLSASWSPERPGRRRPRPPAGRVDTPGARRGQEAAAGGPGRTGRPRSRQLGPVPGEDGGPFLWAGGLGLEVAFLCVRGYVAACVTGHTSSACLSWTPPQRLLPAVTMGLVSPAVPTPDCGVTVTRVLTLRWAVPSE